ncbi:MAG: GNAT family N-acetyltransferase [Actinobacteria bacterium]|nr:GNAT family N-acetyltransferase [Actinomycetota bacterium]
MSAADFCPGIGRIFIRVIDEDEPRPSSTSVYEEWGEMAPEARDMLMLRWMVEAISDDGKTTQVGDMSAHAVWYGPTLPSKAMNIGISLVNECRGKGIGSIAQRLLAAELHRLGFIRVEAQTDVKNIAEQKALNRAGFILEGVARKAQGRADGIHDLQVWSHISD